MNDGELMVTKSASRTRNTTRIIRYLPWLGWQTQFGGVMYSIAPKTCQTPSNKRACTVTPAPRKRGYYSLDWMRGRWLCLLSPSPHRRLRRHVLSRHTADAGSWGRGTLG